MDPPPTAEDGKAQEEWILDQFLFWIEDAVLEPSPPIGSAVVVDERGRVMVGEDGIPLTSAERALGEVDELTGDRTLLAEANRFGSLSILLGPNDLYHKDNRIQPWPKRQGTLAHKESGDLFFVEPINLKTLEFLFRRELAPHLKA